MKRYDLVRLVKDVARHAFSVSRVGADLLEHLILSCRDSDFLAGRLCGNWEQPSTIADQLGVSVRVLNNAERELGNAGFIVKTSTPHGRRFGERLDGIIVRLGGLSLAPLINRVAELMQAREAIQLHRRAMKSLKTEIAELRGRIKLSGKPSQIAIAEQILPRGRTSRIADVGRLEEIKTNLEGLLEYIDLPSGSPECTNGSEENCAPITPKIDSSRNRMRASGITPAQAIQLATEDYQATISALGGASWPNLVQASAWACSWLGISKRLWGDACNALGRDRAAICVLVLDRNARLTEEHRYRAKSPADCLAGMSRRVGLNLHGLLLADNKFSPKSSLIPLPILASKLSAASSDARSVGAILSSRMQQTCSVHVGIRP